MECPQCKWPLDDDTSELHAKIKDLSAVIETCRGALECESLKCQVRRLADCSFCIARNGCITKEALKTIRKLEKGGKDE